MRRCEMCKNLFFITHFMAGGIFHQKEPKTDLGNTSFLYIKMPKHRETRSPQRKGSEIAGHFAWQLQAVQGTASDQFRACAAV